MTDIEKVGMGTSAAKVQRALQERGLTVNVREMAETTRTASDAARAIGCDVNRIVKSLVFRGSATGKPAIFLVSGGNRLDETVAATAVGESLERASPDFVRQVTGFAIGGVPPLGHPQQIPVWMDKDLLSHTSVWAAAGTPFAVFEIEPTELQRVTDAMVVELKHSSA